MPLPSSALSSRHPARREPRARLPGVAGQRASPVTPCRCPGRQRFRLLGGRVLRGPALPDRGLSARLVSGPVLAVRLRERHLRFEDLDALRTKAVVELAASARYPLRKQGRGRIGSAAHSKRIGQRDDEVEAPSNAGLKHHHDCEQPSSVCAGVVRGSRPRFLARALGGGG